MTEDRRQKNLISDFRHLTSDFRSPRCRVATGTKREPLVAMRRSGPARQVATGRPCEFAALPRRNGLAHHLVSLFPLHIPTKLNIE